MDLNIDVEQAMSWKEQVNNELEAVKALLQQVAECCKSDPAQDDPIIKMLVDTGEKLEENWSSLTNVFEQAMGAIGEAIQLIKSAIELGVDIISEFGGRIGK